MAELPAELLADVKTYLDIEGDHEDVAISVIIEAGIEVIKGIAGMRLTYTEDGRPRDILFNYCADVYAGTYDADTFKAKWLNDLLLISVKNYLDITWHDPAGDNKLAGIIARGMQYMNKTAGTELDYTEEAKPRELLFDYCRYVRSGGLEDFQTNFLPELLSLQIHEEVRAYAEAEAADI